MNLQTSLDQAGLLYKKYASRLAKLHILKLEDFLYHIPFRYDDFSLLSPIEKLKAGAISTVIGEVTEIKNNYTKSGKQLQKAIIADGSGTLHILWFNQPYITKTLQVGTKASFSGRIEQGAKGFILTNPAFEVVYENNPTIHTGRLVPIYPETQGVSSKWLRRQSWKLLIEHKDYLNEYLPSSIIDMLDLEAYSNALEHIHFPKNMRDIDRAKYRLAFDELFFLQLASLQRKKTWHQEKKGHVFAIEPFQKHIQTFLQSLPFTLTAAQKKSLHEIFQDFSLEKPMNRLLEGDVGSGKTVVAAIAMYLAYLNGFQSVFMAPTEILANQHYETIVNLLKPFDIKVGLATGSKKQQLDIFSILVGTHAVLSQKIQFEKLGLVVIDEQQRFGVQQRAILKEKGTYPHLLTMTATPIPRTVALTMYGDLDLSVLDELPKGRKYIKTWLVPQLKRDSAYQWIEKQIKETDSQVFIVCPFIEESETMTTVKAAAKEFETLQKDVFPHLKLGLLHGKLKAKAKNQILADFKDKKIDMLVATPVVEVGIDIPNATIIVIEASERFGLAQLHQLRGRVGRGEKQSYCLLFSESKSPQTLQRLKAMETMHVGSILAELDLKLRGPGDIYGTAQSGVPELKVANFSDFALIQKAKEQAENIFPRIENYPQLFKKLQTIVQPHIAKD